ncbi:MAG: adenylate kinase [Dehalococcoidia bacterium]|nr:adenylate kinase [Dehalococcoidia bacterium]
MHVIMLGAPGAGKGTQAEILSQQTGLPHIASGDLFRQALAERTEIGLLAREYMDRGELVPDEVAIVMILDRVSNPDCEAGCLLDGFPRTLQQAEALDRALSEHGKGIDKAVYIEVPDDILVKRLSGRRLCRVCQRPYHLLSAPPKAPGKCDRCGGELFQRSDDSEETVKERLGVFFAQTMPMLGYYERQDKLIRVDGSREIQAVAADIASALRAAIQ